MSGIDFAARWGLPKRKWRPGGNRTPDFDTLDNGLRDGTTAREGFVRHDRPYVKLEAD
jgi:hypothetical protein